LVAAIPGPAWLRDSRLSAWEHFSSAGLPSASEEIWRYSRVDDLELGRYRPPAPGSTPSRDLESLPPGLMELVAAAGERATVLVVHNGATGRVSRPQEGLAVQTPGEGLFGADGELRLPLQGPPPDVFSTLNAALCEAPWRVSVPGGARVAGPLVVVHWLEGDGLAAFPRLEVELGPQASLDVVEVMASGDEAMLVVPVTRLALGAGARLRYGQLQLLGPGAWQLANQVSRLSRDASLLSMSVALGGDYARVRTGSVLDGPGGESELLAAYFGTGHQMHDLRTIQHHSAPRSRSALLFKGAVAGTAHSVYSGLIRVEKGAKGTNAFQTNRNLVLSDGAQADSVPNLEIEDNDVKCSHASAVGPIDESQLFYLESRGVPTGTAKRLITLGFMDEVLEKFPVAAMVPWLRRELAGRLAAAGLPEPGSGVGEGS
jgi:Fe-S cluster assembly protein SufD